jgi:hypothetical protein
MPHRHRSHPLDGASIKGGRLSPGTIFLRFHLLTHSSRGDIFRLRDPLLAILLAGHPDAMAAGTTSRLGTD